jgi:hypothetical protein
VPAPSAAVAALAESLDGQTNAAAAWALVVGLGMGVGVAGLGVGVVGAIVGCVGVLVGLAVGCVVGFVVGFVVGAEVGPFTGAGGVLEPPPPQAASETATMSAAKRIARGWQKAMLERVGAALRGTLIPAFFCGPQGQGLGDDRHARFARSGCRSDRGVPAARSERDVDEALMTTYDPCDSRHDEKAAGKAQQRRIGGRLRASDVRMTRRSRDG